MENYKRVLEVSGDIAGNFVADRAVQVDIDGAEYNDGKVTYAKGTRENLQRSCTGRSYGNDTSEKVRRTEFPVYYLHDGS